jgi:inosine-uridine nucleoside N-ribohydrolase
MGSQGKRVILILRVLTVCILSMSLTAAPSSAAGRMKVMVDTDAGLDDLIALAFLLSRPEVDLQAITIVNGMARVDRGSRNVCRLLALAGRDDVPVFTGSTRPMPGGFAYPDELRRQAEDLPGVDLPSPRRRPGNQTAANILADTLSGDRNGDLRILAFGPLVNIADAARRLPRMWIRSLTIAEGEWNLPGDPENAQVVCGIRNPLAWVPIESAKEATLDKEFLSDLEIRAGGRPLGNFVFQILSMHKSRIETQPYFSPELLSAVVLAAPAVAKMQDCRLGPEADSGQMRCLEGAKANAKIVTRIDGAAFRKVLLDSLSR